MSEKKDIGNVLKSAMDGYTAAPDDLWPALESTLKRQKRIRMLLWLLLLLSVSITTSILLYHTNSDTSASDQVDKTIPSKEDPQNIQDSETQKTISTDSLSTKIFKQTVESENILTQKKSEIKEINQLSDHRQKDSKNKDRSKGTSKTEILKRANSSHYNFLSMLEAEQLGKLQLIIDSLDLSDLTTLPEGKKVESTWRVSPFGSLDHYNAFGRSTSQQNTLNYGAYLYFYGSSDLALRIGFKKTDLQYNFLDRNDPSRQEVSYMEVPIEARYFFNTEKQLKTSFIAGGSFLFVQNATLTDFNNNVMSDNRDLFTDSSFSLNAGLGIHYDLSSKWRLNLESVFKYHVTPFSRTRDFSPYNISLSFGIEYGF